MSAAVAGTTFRPTPTYTTLRDVTAVREVDLEKALARARQERQRGNAREAEAHLRDVLVTYPWADPVWYELAETVAATGDHQAALASLSAALTLRPHEPTLWRSLARTLQAINNDDEARIAMTIHDRLPGVQRSSSDASGSHA
jgi:predicted Zn-dependent protease